MLRCASYKIPFFFENGGGSSVPARTLTLSKLWENINEFVIEITLQSLRKVVERELKITFMIL